MKILFTGMASSHSKPSSNVNFFKLFASSLEGKADIEWAVPSLTWDKDYLDQYDLIFVGIVPPTSPSANKLYGAMHVINIMFDSPKLNLIVDHPQLWQFKSGFNSIYKNISGVFTPFYSKRKEFSLAKESVHSASISTAAEKLLTLKWPRTIYPKLPWQNDLDILLSLGANPDTEIVGINLDSNLLVDKPEITYDRSGWAVDAPNTKWSKKIISLLSSSVSSTKLSNKSNDYDANLIIKSSIGLLFSPQDRNSGTWWSYRHVQAMNALVPVVSDWRETSRIGESWNVLGSSLEELSSIGQLELAANQRQAYILSIPSKLELVEILDSLINNSLKGEK
jgi:hypothetical protein